MRGARSKAFGAAVAICIAAGCSSAEADYQPRLTSDAKEQAEYTFAVHPLHNPALLHEKYGPLISYLNRNGGGAKFRLVASRDYGAFNRRLASGEFDFALPNPYQAVRSTSSGYRIFGKVAGDENFRGIILVRRDSRIAAVDDLRGKTVSYPASTAVAATMLPQYFLHRNGVRLADVETLYVGSMESAIRSVISGSSHAAAVWPEPWRRYVRAHPEAARVVDVKWVTPPLVNNGLITHKRVPARLAERVITLLSALDETAAGRRMLDRMEIAGFEEANDAAYAPVRAFLDNFSREVRPLPARLADPA